MLLLAGWIWSIIGKPSEIERVIAYIANQHEHHRKKTFQEEYRAFLYKHNIEYDEKYVWE